MADLSLVNDNYFTIASETFADNLSSSISAGAATVPVNNASEYTNGDCVVLTVDPGTVNEATFIGKKNGSQFEECVWTEGNLAVGHSNGATIIDYDSATHHNAQTKGIKEFANDDGTLITQAVRDALNLSASAVNGWEILPYTLSVTTGYNKGNKSFDVTVANNDLTGTLSPGMRLRFERGTAAPTQCLDLESGSSQYAQDTTLTGITFTDDCTLEAWVKLESYALMGVVTRYNGTSGFELNIDASGRPYVTGLNGGAANYRQVLSVESLPLGMWVHVAATLDMSGWTTATNKIYLNGTDVPVTLSSAGTNPTALIQAGNLQIGATNSVGYFDGGVADVRIWNAIRTSTQIRDNMYQQLAGSETNLVGYWKLNGNLNDSTTNANNLTGSGGAVATTTDHPMKTTEYGIIQSVTYSAPNTTINVFTGNSNSVPNMTLSSPYYSTQKAPYLFPAEEQNWCLSVILLSSVTTAIGAITQWYSGIVQITVPIGKWTVGHEGEYVLNSSVSGVREGDFILSPAAELTAYSGNKQPLKAHQYEASSNYSFSSPSKSTGVTISTATAYIVYGGINSATGSESLLVNTGTKLYARNGYF